jgi:hypothetical protein
MHSHNGLKAEIEFESVISSAGHLRQNNRFKILINRIPFNARTCIGIYRMLLCSMKLSEKTEGLINPLNVLSVEEQGHIGAVGRVT